MEKEHIAASPQTSTDLASTNLTIVVESGSSRLLSSSKLIFLSAVVIYIIGLIIEYSLIILQVHGVRVLGYFAEHVQLLLLVKVLDRPPNVREHRIDSTEVFNLNCV